VAVFQVPGLPPLAWRTVIGPRWPRLLERAEGVPTTADYPSPTAAQDGATGVRLYRRNMPRRVRHPRTDAVAHAPVQLVVPTKDPFVSPALYDGLERWVPTLRRRTLVAGHWAPRTHADAVARWIGEFADDVDGGHPLGRRERRSPLVLVTGAGSGIGRATALAFAREGAEVIAVDVDGPSAGDTARECEAVGANAHAETADVADASAMDDLAKRVRDAYGTLDVLVNNAGVGAAGPFLASSLDDWRRVLSVNLWGVIHGCRLFGRQMVDRGEGGHIVNVSSAAAFQPSRALPLYSTSKAGVLMLTECLRAEFADAGIGVTAICPGLINTNITRTTTFAGVSAEEQERLRARTTRLYRRRNFGPERVAADIVRAVRQNRAVVPVSPEAKAALALHRFAPGILRRLARVELS
jgi:NAD(P)-dependent dehydrogenase (short-subunit alcohol dehydrogenase family)